MINLLLSMVGPKLADNQASIFSLVGEWVILNERNHRMLVDAIGPAASMRWILGALDYTGRGPIVIGAWHPDGSRVEGVEFNEAAWLAVAPDKAVGEDASPERYTEFTDIHRWQGWAEKD